MSSSESGRDRAVEATLRPRLAWTTRWQMIRLICRGTTYPTAVRIAAVVGTLLTLVNQGQELTSGHIGLATVLRVAANYLIPYVVSSIGYLTPFRVRTQNRPD